MVIEDADAFCVRPHDDACVIRADGLKMQHTLLGGGSDARLRSQASSTHISWKGAW